MVLTKPWSGSKRGFCRFTFLPSQLLAGKHDTWLLFLQINYIFVTLRKQGLIQMGASFLVRECKKGGEMNAETRTERELLSRKAGRQVCFCSVSLPRVCACLHSGAGLCICKSLIWGDNMNAWLHNKKKIRIWRDLSDISYLCLRLVYTP